MFDSTISIDDHAAAAKSFVQIALDATGSTRIDSGTSLATPRLMLIKHTSVPAKGTTPALDRHLLSFSVKEADASNSTATATVNLTIAMPQSIIDTTDVQHLIAFVKNFLSDANLASLLIGEY